MAQMTQITLMIWMTRSEVNDADDVDIKRILPIIRETKIEVIGYGKNCRINHSGADFSG